MTEILNSDELVQRIKTLEKIIDSYQQKMKEKQEEEEKAKTLIENANDVFVHIDHKGLVIDANKRAEELFGYLQDEIVGKNFTEVGIVQPGDMIKSKEHFNEILNGNPSKMLEIEARCKDMSTITIECNSSPIKKDGMIKGILVVIRDISERKRAEEELRISEEKSRTIFETANDLIVYVGIDGIIHDVNARVADIFGYDRNEIIGRNHTEFNFLDKKNLENTVEFYADIMAGKPVQMLEIEALRRDRTTVYIELTCRLIQKNGEPKGFLNVLRDITERKQAEAALRMHRDHLEELVTERTANLEETNTALKVLLKKREEDKQELEEKMLFNVKELILPYMEKIKNSNLENKIRTYINIIDTNLNDITSPFVRKLSSKYLNFTSGEIQVANLIKHGMATKEIAEALNLSHRTIDFHRGNIRKKIGIKNLKANLRAYLLSLQ